jgi:hypothetical protein
MNATTFSFGLLIVLFTILLLHRMHKLKPQMAGYGSHKDVPMLWIDHISIEGVLLGVRQVSYGRECDPDSGEMNFS